MVMKGSTSRNKKVDKRILRSRALIMQAFETLLLKMPLSDITVSAIAREAGIDRKTFYQHFGTVDGLLDAIAEESVDVILETVNEKIGGLTVETPDEAQAMARVFFSLLNEAIPDNLLINRRLIENIPVDDFMHRVREPLERELIERDVVPEGMRTELFDYYIAFLLSGIIGIYRTWALSDGHIELEKITEIANSLTMDGLSSLSDRL